LCCTHRHASLADRLYLFSRKCRNRNLTFGVSVGSITRTKFSAAASNRQSVGKEAHALKTCFGGKLVLGTLSSLPSPNLGLIKASGGKKPRGKGRCLLSSVSVDQHQNLPLVDGSCVVSRARAGRSFLDAMILILGLRGGGAGA